MRRTRYLQSLFAAAALAAPLLAAADPRYAVTAIAGPDSVARDINNLGQVVGSLYDGANGRAFVYGGGILAELGTLSYGDGSRAYAINNRGDVVGAAANTFNGAPNWPEDPFIFHNGVMSGLGNLGGPWSAATSINDLGQVVGYLGVDSLPGNPDDLYPRSAFLYENGRMHMLDGLPADWSSVAADVNNLGQVVGIAGRNPGAGFAFLYENGQMIDLNTLIDPASGWTITDAAAINDLQQIAAQACRGGVCQAVRLDLVSAVPEPPVFALMAAGLALGLARGRGFRLPVRRRRG